MIGPFAHTHNLETGDLATGADGAALVIHERLLIQCAGGVVASYTAIVAHDPGKCVMVMPAQIGEIPELSSQGVLLNVMADAGFEFGVGDRMAIKGVDPKLNYAIATERILRELGGVVQRHYRCMFVSCEERYRIGLDEHGEPLSRGIHAKWDSAPKSGVCFEAFPEPAKLAPEPDMAEDSPDE